MATQRLNDRDWLLILDGLKALAERLPENLAEPAHRLHEMLDHCDGISVEIYPEHDGSKPDGAESERLNDSWASARYRD
jgi:hypothetical protein